MTRPPERVLLVLVAGIGDFVLAIPALRAIRRGFPAARITLLTTPQAAALARPCPHLDEVVTFDLRAYRPGERGAGWSGWRRLLWLMRDLRARRFDLAANLYRVASLGGALRMLLLVAGAGPGRTAGRWSGGLGAFFGIRAPDRPHAMDAMLALAAALGCPPEDARSELWIPDAARRTAGIRLREAGVASGEPFAVLNANSNRPEACLPVEKAVETGRAIQRRAALRVLLTGDAAEAPRLQAICGGIGGAARSLAGRTDLLELAAILERTAVAVSTDSGPMHLAAAAGTPLVALFGPADVARFGPRGRPGQVVVLQGRARPRHPARWHEDLAADEAAEAAARLLSARRAATAP